MRRKGRREKKKERFYQEASPWDLHLISKGVLGSRHTEKEEGRWDSREPGSRHGPLPQSPPRPRPLEPLAAAQWPSQTRFRCENTGASTRSPREDEGKECLEAATVRTCRWGQEASSVGSSSSGSNSLLSLGGRVRNMLWDTCNKTQVMIKDSTRVVSKSWRRVLVSWPLYKGFGLDWFSFFLLVWSRSGLDRLGILNTDFNNTIITW